MITFKEAMEITKNEAFYFKDEIVDNIPFRIFNYRLANFTDFVKDGDFSKSENTKALQLRGLTFRTDTEELVSLGIHKFFNDNENPLSMIEWNEDDILDVREKLDGSLIQTFVIENKIYVKTKGTFNSKQAEKAKEIIDNDEKLQLMIKALHSLYVEPIFEYVSPFNQVVLQYDKTELVMTQVRNKETGEYLDYKFLKKMQKIYGVKIAKEYNYTLKELRKLQETEKNIEGWVVRNKKYPLELQFRKNKTLWYFRLHHLISGDAMQENNIIEAIISENIDDVISQVQVGTEKRKYLEDMRTLVSHFFDRMLVEILELLPFKNKMERKEFVLKYKDHDYFGVIMKSKTPEDAERILKETILKQTYRLKNAKQFIENIKK